MLDEGCVPEEANNQDVDEEDDEKHDKGLEAITWRFARCKVFKHLVCTNIFYLPRISHLFFSSMCTR